MWKKYKHINKWNPSSYPFFFSLPFFFLFVLFIILFLFLISFPIALIEGFSKYIHQNTDIWMAHVH